VGDRREIAAPTRSLISFPRSRPAACTDRGTVEVSVERHGSGARLSVVDEGDGPPPEVVERAFTRFWRAPGARGEGSGLGLAIVRATAERHGGRVSVEGSRFTVDLPLLRDLSGERPKLHSEAANKGQS